MTLAEIALINEFRLQALKVITKFAPDFYRVIHAPTCTYREAMLAGARKWDEAGRPK